MVTLWILGILTALIVLLCLLRVGVLVTLEETVAVRLEIGPFHVGLLPAKEHKEPAKTKKKPKTERADKKEKKAALPKLSFPMLRSGFDALWPLLKRALNRTRRGIRIHPLQLGILLGGREDPASASAAYGYVNAAVWTAMPVLEQLLVIPHPGIHVGVDYDAEKTQFRGQIGLSARIGTLLRIGLGMAWPTLKWFLKIRKEYQQAEAQTPPEPARPAA